jgi:CRP-like cAMP-binding protein
MEDILDVLEKLPLTKKIPFVEAKKLSSYCSLLDYEKGETIYSTNGIKFSYIGVIIDGKVDYYLSGLNGNKKVKLGSFKRYPVGMFNFLELKEETLSIVAAQDTKIIAIKYEKLKEVEKELPLFTIKLYKSIIKLNMQLSRRILVILLNFVSKK